MNNLENFIKKNKNKLNSFELPENHLKRFEKKLTKKNTLGKTYWYALAASFVVLISLTIFIHERQNQQLAVVNQNKVINLSDISPQYKEVEEFYQKDLHRKINEFQQLNCKIDPEQKKMINQELHQLDVVYRSLQEELKINRSNERIINAMINNYQYKIEFLELVIEQIKENC